jgi:AraC family transcriptional regulator
MILSEFPNLQWLKRQALDQFSNKRDWRGQTLLNSGWPTVILNAQTRNVVRDNILGPLSIFTNITGQSAVSTNSKRVIVKEGFFFLSNAQQHYTLEIDSLNPVETFNIHFGDLFVEKVLSSLSNTPENLLENHETTSKNVEFKNRLVQLNPATKTIIRQLHGAKNSDGLFLDEKLFSLFQNLLGEEKRIQKIQQQLPALKSSTRKEILQRLLLATDYIYTHYDQKLSLEELAQACYLSKFHFLRLFKIAFNKTPHQFINEIRVQRAQQLLAQSKLEVQEISRLIGFDTASTFSRAFYKQLGVYPTQFRAGK